MWPVETIAAGVRGAIYRVEKSVFSSISTDSRTIGRDEFFIPLAGPNFDGHLFINNAYERSGGGSLCNRNRAEIYGTAKGTVLLVDDTNQALLDLARFKREHTAGAFVAITGSNGKTTTKELLVHLVGDLCPLVFNEKNYNNHVGVAKALLAIEGHPEFGIFELGTNHPGEIERLSRMVQPHLSLITNVNPSHLEGLSDLDGVRREKLRLFEMTLPGGTVFINMDDPSLASYTVRGDQRAVTFAIGNKADCTLQVLAEKGLAGFDMAIHFPDGRIETTTRLLGRHNLYNVLAAAVLAHAMGVPAQRIREGLATFDAYKGRFRPINSPEGYIVIDDAYNANPASMEFALNTLSALPCKGRRIAALGGMKELGEKTEGYHGELGRYLRAGNLSLILFLGEEMEAVAKGMNNGRAKHFADKRSLIEFLSGQLHRNDIVLVKGSRALGMDEIVEALV
jgi:UDP-N-acetylmuramoyl-tripeptide--D-alanyl-D-alanine ligase